MVRFLEENGFPMTVIVETEVITEKPQEENSTVKLLNVMLAIKPETYYKSTFTDAGGNVLAKFTHTDLRARIHWVQGFYACYKLLKP